MAGMLGKLAGLPFTVAFAAVMLKIITTPHLGALEPQNLRGKTFIVTGATSGLGRSHAEVLASWNASLVLPVRNLESGRRLADRLASTYPGAPRAQVYELELASLDSVRRFAETYTGPVDVLVHNAALLGNGEFRRTADGFEECTQVNYLSTVLLTSLLLDRLEQSAAGRVIHISAKAHEMANISVPALRAEKVLGPDFLSRQCFLGNLCGSYGDSKMAQILFSGALSRRLKPNVVSISLHPSINMNTALKREVEVTTFQSIMQLVFPIVGQAIGFVQSDEDAPKMQIHASTHPALQAAEASGRYYSCLKPPLRKCGKAAVDCAVEKASSQADDEQLQEDLFLASCEVLGLSTEPGDGLCGRKPTAK